MTLQAWIKETGPKNVAHLLKVDSSTVHFWKAGKTLPRPALMVQIHRLTKGKVSYQTMIEDAAKRNRK
jgi:DNA-binding transcriptional regulator YdaS (Cro superfamily)